MQIENVSRRGFLSSMVSAGSLVLGSQVIPFSQLNGQAVAPTWEPNVYLAIAMDGTVSIIAHRSEMGTGIRTILPMVVADEMEADWTKVKVQQALGNKKYGSQNTDGSCSIRDFYEAMRQSGATARTMLEQSASQKWNVPASECKADNHSIVHVGTNRKLTFGELVESASKLDVPKPADLRFKDPAQYRYIGKNLPMIDQSDIVSGKGTFGMDAKRPGMVYASIERPPVLGGKFTSVDDSEALKMRGVERTVQLDGFKPPHAFQALGGVAVIADNTWTAIEARKKLKIEWEHGPNASYDSEAYKQTLLATVQAPQRMVRNVGDVDAEFAKHTKFHEASYYVPLLSHAPMEPPVAVAEFKDGKCTTWAPTQNPQAVQAAVATALGIKEEDVICHVTLLGGGFGRKSKPDYIVEAARLAKRLEKPVKVVWSREDDLRFDYYHAVAAMYMKAALDDKGKPVAWLQRSAFPPIGSMNTIGARTGSDGELGMGFVDVPFDLPNHRVENGPADAHVRIGWLRSVANIYHAFAVHSFVDELAAATGKDRVAYLLDVLGEPRKIDLAAQGVKYRTNPKFPIDTGRLRNVIELAAERSGWANKKPGAGRALGIAAHRSFLSYVAAVVDLEVQKNGQVKIHRVDFAVDAGTIIHPDRVKAQFEGAAVFGTTVAMLGEISAKDGQIQQRNFNDYPVARMNEAPYQTHVHIVPSKEPPAGVGEPGVPPIAPAICNAIFAATGKRFRDLPLRKQKLV